MSSRLQTTAVASGMALANVATFAMLFLVGWARSPMAGVNSFIVGGAVVAIWTRRWPAVVVSSTLISVAAVLSLAWAQLKIDNPYITVADAVNLSLRWPGAFLGLGVVMGTTLGLAGWAAAEPTVTRLRRKALWRIASRRTRG